MSVSKLIRRLVFAYRAPKAFAAFQKEHEARAAEAREHWRRVRERGVEHMAAQARRIRERPRYSLKADCRACGRWGLIDDITLICKCGARHELTAAESNQRGLDMYLWLHGGGSA